MGRPPTHRVSRRKMRKSRLPGERPTFVSASAASLRCWIVWLNTIVNNSQIVARIGVREAEAEAKRNA